MATQGFWDIVSDKKNALLSIPQNKRTKKKKKQTNRILAEKRIEV
jgi:hypothetical protein